MLSKIIILKLFAVLAFAAETDQLHCRTDQDLHPCPRSLLSLRESEHEIDAWVNSGLDRLEKKFTNSVGFSQSDFYSTAEAEFMGYLYFAYSPIELHILANPDKFDRIWGGSDGIYEYGGFFDFGWIGGFGPSFPTLKVHGSLVGIDKLSHMFTTGFELFNVFQYFQKVTTLSLDVLFEAVRFYNFKTEVGIFGLTMSGIFSFGDLAANWQGFQFYYALLNGPNPYFEISANGVKLKRLFQIRDYISDDWDEVLNPNLYAEPSLKKKIQLKLRLACYAYHMNPPVFMNRKNPSTNRNYFPGSKPISMDLSTWNYLNNPTSQDDYRVDKLCEP